MIENLGKNVFNEEETTNILDDFFEELELNCVFLEVRDLFSIKSFFSFLHSRYTYCKFLSFEINITKRKTYYNTAGFFKKFNQFRVPFLDKMNEVIEKKKGKIS